MTRNRRLSGSQWLPLVGAVLLMVLAPVEAGAKSKRSNGVKLECGNMRRGGRSASSCTLKNSSHSSKTCKYSIYYSWKPSGPGSYSKTGRHKGSATVASGAKVRVFNGHGWQYKWSSLLLSCK